MTTHDRTSAPASASTGRRRGKPSRNSRAATTAFPRGEGAKTVEDWLESSNPYVRAVCAIPDSPLAREDDSVPEGALGTIEDYLPIDGLLVVVFSGERALLVSPDEVEPA